MYKITVSQLCQLTDTFGGKCFCAFFLKIGQKTENLFWDSATFKTDKMCSTLISMRSAGRKAEKFYLSNWNWMTYLASPFLCRDVGTKGAAPPPLQILADELTLFQPKGADYAHHITTRPPGFYDLPKALLCIWPLMNWFCILIEKLGNPPTIYSVWNKDKSPVLLFVYLKFFQLSGVVIQSHCIAITYMKNVETM